MLDMWGSEWAAREAYELQPTAQRYEQYEVAFAAKVTARWKAQCQFGTRGNLCDSREGSAAGDMCSATAP